MWCSCTSFPLVTCRPSRLYSHWKSGPVFRSYMSKKIYFSGYFISQHSGNSDFSNTSSHCHRLPTLFLRASDSDMARRRNAGKRSCSPGASPLNMGPLRLCTAPSLADSAAPLRYCLDINSCLNQKLIKFLTLFLPLLRLSAQGGLTTPHLSLLVSQLVLKSIPLSLQFLVPRLQPGNLLQEPADLIQVRQPRGELAAGVGLLTTCLAIPLWKDRERLSRWCASLWIRVLLY